MKWVTINETVEGPTPKLLGIRIMVGSMVLGSGVVGGGEAAYSSVALH